MAGFIIMDRDWQEHDLFEGDEFSRRDAWHWLICNAAWKATAVRVAGKRVKLGRGELCFSVRFIAGKWGWSKSRVARFLHELADEGMIETRLSSGTVAGQSAGQRAGQSQSVITICNYDRFQSQAQGERDSERDSDDEKAGQSWDKEEQGKQKESISRAHSLPENWEAEPFGDGSQSARIVRGWSEQRFASEVEAFKAHHRAKGSKHKDWQSAWSTWVLNSAKFDRPTSPRGATADDPDGRYAFLDTITERRAAGAGR